MLLLLLVLCCVFACRRGSKNNVAASGGQGQVMSSRPGFLSRLGMGEEEWEEVEWWEMVAVE